MEASNPIRDDAGEVPFISMTGAEWAGWFGLNIDATRTPKNFDLYVDHDENERDFDSELITKSGKLDEMDWGAICDWFRSHYPWRGFIPIKDADGEYPCPEYLDFDEVTPTIRSQRGQWYIPARIALNLANRFTTLEELVQACLLPQLGDNILLPRPPTFNQHSLGSVPFESEDKLRRALTAVKRAIADRMGWLAWFRAFIPQPILRDKIPTPIITSLLQETGTEYRRRGFILHLADSWQEINVTLWLTHRIPILYCWRIDERILQQLARMHPKLLAGDTSQDRVSLYDGEDDEDYRVAARASIDFDDFFQDKTAGSYNQHLSFEMDARFYIIDFQGWGRRPLPVRADPSDYAVRFSFHTVQSDEMDDVPTVVFWRWRKKSCTTHMTANRARLMQGEEDESFIREAYRTEYAPRKGRSYDEETGEQLPSAPDDQEMSFEPFADHRRGPRSDESDSESTDQSSSDETDSSANGSVQGREGQSLFVRLGISQPSPSPEERPYSTVANLTSWRNSVRMDSGRDTQRHEPGSSTQIVRNRRSSRSPAPRGPPTNGIVSSQRPLDLFRRKLKDIAHFVSHDDFRTRLPFDFDWNPLLLEKGVLLVTEKRTEVRLRYFANAFIPNMRHVSSLLKLALEKRLEFNIAIKETDLHLFSRFSIRHADRINGSYIYGPDFEEAPLEFKSATEFAANYIA